MSIFHLSKDKYLTLKMQYNNTISFLYEQLPMFQRQGKRAFKKDLGNIEKLANYLENPHNYFRSIHVAGTNGKGTVSHLLASILQEHGLKVGLYTSPHYKDFRERIKINGEFISKKAVVDFVNQVKPALKEIQSSFFELTVAMAFQYFKNQKVDIAIIETGLGGRLDSTNIIKPELSIITNISLDHTDMLGETLPKIAVEKAGIIKRATPVIIGESHPETKPVFLEKASKEDAPLYFANDLITEEKLSDFLPKITSNPFLSRNIRTALASMSKLELPTRQHWHKEKIREGLEKVRENTYYVGRWEVLRENPLTIADSAHNEAGLRVVIEQLSAYEFNHLHIVLGFVKDKNIDRILRLFPSDAFYYFVKAAIPRGLDAQDLKEKAKFHNLNGRSYVNVKAGYKAALRKADINDLVYIGGSIFVIAEII